MVSIKSFKLTVLNGGGGHLALVSICALVSIYSYKLTVLNGVSVMIYISEEFTPFTGSFKQGVHLSSIYMHCTRNCHS